MIDGLTVRPTYGAPMTFSLPASDDGYQIRKIEGLGPVPVVLASSKRALMDGEVFQGSRREKRNIVVHIKLDQNYAGSSIETRRLKLMALFASGELELEFSRQNNPDVTIRGYVEDVEVAIFTDEPIVIASIVCMDPNFKSAVRHEANLYTTIFVPQRETIEYGGTVPTGLTFEGTIPNSLTSVLIVETNHLDSGQRTGRVRIGPIHGHGLSHEWQIISIPGQKRIWELHRNESIMTYADFSDLIWPTLYPGSNQLIFTAYQGVRVPGWSGDFYWHELYGAI